MDRNLVSLEKRLCRYAAGREVFDRLVALARAPHFSRVGFPRKDDTKLLRVGSWEAAAHSRASLRLVRSEVLTPMYETAHETCRCEAAWAFSSLGYEWLSRSMGCWTRAKRPGVLNLAFGTLADDSRFWMDSVYLHHKRAQSFLLPLLRFFEQGHWPCGYDGSYPGGRWIVF